MTFNFDSHLLGLWARVQYAASFKRGEEFPGLQWEGSLSELECVSRGGMLQGGDTEKGRSWDMDIGIVSPHFVPRAEIVAGSDSQGDPNSVAVLERLAGSILILVSPATF